MRRLTMHLVSLCCCSRLFHLMRRMSLRYLLSSELEKRVWEALRLSTVWRVIGFC